MTFIWLCVPRYKRLNIMYHFTGKQLTIRNNTFYMAYWVAVLQKSININFTYESISGDHSTVGLCHWGVTSSINVYRQMPLTRHSVDVTQPHTNNTNPDGTWAKLIHTTEQHLSKYWPDSKHDINLPSFQMVFMKSSVDSWSNDTTFSLSGSMFLSSHWSQL